MSSTSEVEEILRRTPNVLRALLSGLPAEWTETPDSDGGWRPKDVVGHLMTAEMTDWLPRIERILEYGTGMAFEKFDRFAHVTRDASATLDELVERFASLRAQNLDKLGALVTDDDLARKGLHPSLGEVTLAQLLATWAVHDLDHIGQIYAGLAGSHETDVGPWKAYLGILLRREDPAAIAG